MHTRRQVTYHTTKIINFLNFVFLCQSTVQTKTNRTFLSEPTFIVLRLSQINDAYRFYTVVNKIGTDSYLAKRSCLVGLVQHGNLFIPVWDALYFNLYRRL